MISLFRKSACISIAFTLIAASTAHADDALLMGFSAGASFAGGRGRRATPYFKVGAGLDWLDEDGFVVLSRIEANHERDVALSLAAGWWAQGLRANRGTPLGAALGATLAIDRDAHLLAGPRAQFALGLWYARAVLELDVMILHAVSKPRGDEPRGIEIALGLSLRIVPWSPFEF